MTLTSRLFRLFSLSRGNAGRARVPRLDSLNLSNHDLADLNLPPYYYYRASFDSDRALMLPDQHR